MMPRGTAQVVPEEFHLAFGTPVPSPLYPLSKPSRQMSLLSQGRLESQDSRSSRLTNQRLPTASITALELLWWLYEHQR